MPRYRKGLGKVYRRSKNGKPVGAFFFKFGGEEISTGTRDKREATIFQLQYVADAARGPVSRSRETKVNELFDLLEAKYRGSIDGDEDQRRKATTNLKGLLSRLKNLRKFFGAKLAESVTAKQVREYVTLRQKQSKRRLAPATINRDLESLSASYGLGIDERIVLLRPKIQKLEEHNIREEFLEPEQYETMRDAFDRAAGRLFFVIAYHVGWRAGHIRDLKWEHVDLDAERPTMRSPGGQAANKPAGKAPLYGDLLRELLKAKMERDRDYPDCPYLIQTGGEKVRTHRGFWNRARALAGLPKLRAHDLRRTAARNMIREGIDETTVLHIVGWKTRAMLIRYRIVSDKDIVDAGRTLEKAFAERAQGDEKRLVQ